MAGYFCLGGEGRGGRPMDGMCFFPPFSPFALEVSAWVQRRLYVLYTWDVKYSLSGRFSSLVRRVQLVFTQPLHQHFTICYPFDLYALLYLSNSTVCTV